MRIRSPAEHARAARERFQRKRPAVLPPEDRIHLGHDEAHLSIRISDKVRLEHLHVIGATGSGKSNNLKAISASDYARGRGGAFLDPHGGHPDSPFAHLVRWTTSTGLVNRGRVHVVDLAQPHLIGFNPLAPLPGTDFSVIADVLLDAFERVWDDENTHGKPTIRSVLKATFIALAELGLTIPDAKLIYDPQDRAGLRAHVIDQLRHEYARDELARLHQTALDERSKRDFRAEVIGPINRLNEFVSSQRVAAMLGQTERPLDLLRIMDAGEIVLVNLQDGETASPADMRLLGTILVRYVLFLSQRRECVDPFFLTIDECGRYLSGDMPTLLAEARKYGVGLTLAHQALFQLGEPGDRIREAVANLTETKIYFRLKSYAEAEALAQNVVKLNLEMPVAALVKPTAVGQKLVELASSSTGTSQSVSTAEAHSEGTSDSIGESTSETWSQTESESDSVSESSTDGESTANSVADATSRAIGVGSSSGTNQSFDPGAPRVPTALSASLGSNLSTVNASASSRSASSGSMSARLTGVSRGTSRSSGYARSHAISRAHSTSKSRSSAVGHTDGRSETRGTSQAFATVYERLPTAVHSKENVLTMAAQALLDLPVGTAFIANREVRGLLRVPYVETKPLTKQALSVLVANAVAASRYAVPLADALAHIAARRRDLLQAAMRPIEPIIDKVEPESWREPFDYPDPPPPPDAPRGKPQLRVVRSDENGDPK